MPALRGSGGGVPTAFLVTERRQWHSGTPLEQGDCGLYIPSPVRGEEKGVEAQEGKLDLMSHAEGERDGRAAG